MQDTDRLYCVECQDIIDRAREKYDAKHPGRPRNRKTPIPVAQRTRKAAARRDDYDARKAVQKCTRAGCADPAYGESTMCRRHRDEGRAIARRWHRGLSWNRNLWLVIAGAAIEALNASVPRSIMEGARVVECTMPIRRRRP